MERQTVFDRPALQLDVASALCLGKRDTQEDAIITDFTLGNRLGIVVLADGMGGHNAGDMASNLVVTEAYRMLRHAAQKMLADPDEIPDILLGAAQTANVHLQEKIAAHPGSEGMGCTLIIAVELSGKLYWVSVGDSAIYLLRDGKVERLNEDHSLAPQIDYMAQQGMLTEAEARTHPDRSVLTSAINGEAIRYVDCRAKGFALRHGDTVIVASDGLLSLGEAQIGQIVSDGGQTGSGKSAATASRFLAALRKLDHPDQDNAGFALISVSGGQEVGAANLKAMREVDPPVDAPKLQAASGDTEPETADAEARPLFRRLRAISASVIG